MKIRRLRFVVLAVTVTCLSAANAGGIDLAKLSDQDREEWSQQWSSLINMSAVDKVDRTTLHQAKQHFSAAKRIHDCAELHYSMALVQFAAGRHTDVLKSLKAKLDSLDVHRARAENLFCHSSFAGRRYNDVFGFAEDTFKRVDTAGSVSPKDHPSIELMGRVLAFFSELERPPSALMKRVARLDTEIRSSRNSDITQNYLIGYDGLVESVKVSQPMNQREEAETAERLEKIDQIAEARKQAEAGQEALKKQRDAQANQVQKMVDTIDRWLLPREPAARQMFAAQQRLDLEIVQLQQAAQQPNLSELQRLQLVERVGNCVNQQTALRNQLAPFLARWQEKQRLAAQFKAATGQALQQNAALAGLQQQLETQADNLATRVDGSQRKKLSTADKLALVFPVDVENQAAVLLQQCQAARRNQ